MRILFGGLQGSVPLWTQLSPQRADLVLHNDSNRGIGSNADQFELVCLSHDQELASVSAVVVGFVGRTIVFISNAVIF